MSYEGYVEWKCICGEVDTSDAYDKQPTRCPSCGSRFERCRSIDQTNGHEAGPWRDVKYRDRFDDYIAVPSPL